MSNWPPNTRSESNSSNNNPEDQEDYVIRFLDYVSFNVNWERFLGNETRILK